jgi:hypothetical protein
MLSGVDLRIVRRDSVDGINILYGLGGPGIESRVGARFSAPVPSRPTMGPTQPPVKWVPGYSLG